MHLEAALKHIRRNGWLKPSIACRKTRLYGTVSPAHERGTLPYHRPQSRRRTGYGTAPVAEGGREGLPISRGSRRLDDFLEGGGHIVDVVGGG